MAAAEHDDLARGIAGTAQLPGELIDFGNGGGRLRIGGNAGAVGGEAITGSVLRGRTAGTNATDARGAVMRSNSPVAIAPALSISVASVAISTIGSFFGYAGVLDTLAREMMRPSAGAASIFSRVVASRYLAR